MSRKYISQTPSHPRVDLDDLLKKSIEAVNNMSPEEREAMWAEQRKSWGRSMFSCFDDADAIIDRIYELDLMIADAANWGAALSEMQEERRALKAKLKNMFVPPPEQAEPGVVRQAYLAGRLGQLERQLNRTHDWIQKLIDRIEFERETARWMRDQSETEESTDFWAGFACALTAILTSKEAEPFVKKEE